ncbi:hypothetical protein [Streptomyces shenzhenensis]|uniref:hypothetical protein n=1 Tax=Streptomyces shenzhenensis TaxID=943815 RepID=UPI001F21FDCD|nr:hypothetical protein [Streptomyces shenzhenensis]
MSESNQRYEGSENERYFAAFDSLDPSEFVALHRVAVNEHDEDIGSGEITSAFDAFESQRKGNSIESLTSEYLDFLPSRSLDRAKLVYETFAASPHVKDRLQVARLCPRELARVDYDAGMDLWDRLIRDPDKIVRREARDEFKPDAPDLTERWALTREDAVRLDQAYRSAEQGIDLHYPFRHAGELALKHFVELLDASDEPQVR